MDDMDQHGFDSTHGAFIRSRQAANLLGVQLQTVYSYTARGLIRVIPNPSGAGNLYLVEDLLRLKARHDARAGHGPRAPGARRWGEPVLDSSITRIEPEGPVYRGKPAFELARSAT